MKRTLTSILCCSLLILAASLFYQSCKKADKIADVQENIVPETVKDQVKALGFSTQGIRAVDEGYVVEGDIFLSYEDLKRHTPSPTLRIAQSEQYRTNYLIGSLPRVITVSVTGLPAGYTTATDIAIARYNALNLRLSFQRVSSGGQVNIQYASLGAGILGQSAGFPTTGGNPPSPIKLNSDANALGSNPDQNYLATVIAHEIGHTIGLRHTDYFNRAYSCGIGGNEGDAGVGAINIPGTPTAADPNSWMLACIGTGVNRPFNTNDQVALNYLYGQGSAGAVIAVTVMQNGTILGVGTDLQLYTKANLTSPWVAAPNVGGAVTDIAIMQDGAILGIGTDQQLYTRATLNSPWQATPNVGGAVNAVAIMQDGTILGVGTDQQLYTRANLNSSWAATPNVGGAVTGVAIMQNGAILGIGTDQQLYTRATLSSPWAATPNVGGAVIGVAVMPNGTILGIGTDQQLYTRATLSSPWVKA